MLGMLRRFARDRDGSITVEAVLVFPMLVWVPLACLVFFEAFRAQSVSVKAAYTIGDVLSRVEEGFITPAYMDSLDALHDFLVTEDTERQLRVTVLMFKAGGAGTADDAYKVCWSEARGGVAAMSDAALTGIRDRLPAMADGHVAVLVETRVEHVPPFDVLEPFIYENFVVTRLRFAPQLVWNSRDDGGGTTKTCL